MNAETKMNTEDLFLAARDAYPQAAIHAYQNYQRELRRIIARAAALPDFEEIKLNVVDGSTLMFMGRLLGDITFMNRSGIETQIVQEVFETPAGAFVAVTTSTPINGGFSVIRAEVIEPIVDTQKMRKEVMRFFGWGNRARQMASRIGWQFKEWVD